MLGAFTISVFGAVFIARFFVLKQFVKKTPFIGQAKRQFLMITRTIFKEISFVITILLILVINILYSYSKNLKLLFQTETDVSKSVSNCDLSTLVPVATSDEFGVIATYTNKQMTLLLLSLNFFKKKMNIWLKQIENKGIGRIKWL